MPHSWEVDFIVKPIIIDTLGPLGDFKQTKLNIRGAMNCATTNAVHQRKM